MQAARPRVLLAPLQFGPGVELYHHFASRFLIDFLYYHGFCCSYSEVKRFERNAAQAHGTDISNLTSEFVQYAADNVDHNLCTLDGNGTFHGMGMIAAITPATHSMTVMKKKKTVTVKYSKKIKRFLSKSRGCRVVKSTTGPQCKLTRNKHGMVTRLTC